jgi:hypothetical protein
MSEIVEIIDFVKQEYDMDGNLIITLTRKNEYGEIEEFQLF